MKTSIRRVWISFLACFVALPALAADPATLKVIAAFNGLGSPAGILEGSPGVFYSSGTQGSQPVFTITPQGAITYLATFPTGVTGGGPFIGGDNGRFYGTAYTSASRTSSVFSVASLPGSKKVYANLTTNPVFTQNLPDGTLLGFALGPAGAYDLVTADLNGNVTPFYEFPAGEVPQFFTLLASDGNYYGVSVLPDGPAYVYRATPSGSVTKIYNFPSQSFYQDTGPSLIQADDGNLYGTTPKGGDGLGTIYKLTLDGEYTLLYSMPPAGISQWPGSMLEAGDGNLYGTTSSNFYAPNGGSSQVFRITKSGDFSVVADLNADGLCSCWLIQGSDGVLYGAASWGGQYGFGSIFSVDAGLPLPRPWAQHFHPDAGPAGTRVRIWGSNLFGAAVEFNGTPAGTVSNSGSNYVWATVLAGAATGPIAIVTPGGTITTSDSFTVQ
jgi:uncharacterized repeat protein (TIGR03803 family)